MSYYFQMADQDFKISPDKINAAHEALYNYAIKDLDESVIGWYWTSPAYMTKQKWRKSFDALMLDMGFAVDGSAGGVDYIELHYEKYRDTEFEMFQVLAPFVEEGSFIQFVGEDCSVWRYAFKNGKCVEQYVAEVRWEDA